MLGYTVGIPEKASTYGNAKRNEQFWRCASIIDQCFQGGFQESRLPTSLENGSKVAEIGGQYLAFIEKVDYDGGGR